MEYYAIQVLTRHEDDFARDLARVAGDGVDIVVPKRAMPIRRGGKTKQELLAVFPSYVFVGLENRNAFPELHWKVKRTRYFTRILPNNQTQKPLAGADLRLLNHFMAHGRRADISKVKFDVDNRIVVVEGPLKGIEGFIVKVDRRKGRAKVRLAMCENSFAFDLAFSEVELAEKAKEPGHGQ